MDSQFIALKGHKKRRERKPEIRDRIGKKDKVYKSSIMRK